jgi:hypothetical protein
MALESASALDFNMIMSAEKIEDDSQQPRCHICRDFNTINLPPVIKWPELPSFAEVEDAAKDGCLGCDVLVNVVRHHHPKVEKQDTVDYRGHRTAIPTDSPSVELYHTRSSGESAVVKLEFLRQRGTLFFTPNIFSYSRF